MSEAVNRVRIETIRTRRGAHRKSCDLPGLCNVPAWAAEVDDRAIPSSKTSGKSAATVEQGVPRLRSDLNPATVSQPRCER